MIKNDSLKPVEQLYLVLVETVSFRCRDRVWVDTNYLVGMPLKPMAPQHSERLENLELKVPILKNPILHHSNMVEIKHALLITSKNAPKFQDTDNMIMPIIIGSTVVSPVPAN